jgi:hypothetical protein
MFSKSARLIVLSCVILAAPLLLGARSPIAWRASPVDAVSLFEDRVAAYVALHHQCVRRLLSNDAGRDSSGGATFRQALADSIRFARQGARPGDILCPALAPRILQLVRADLTARERLEQEAILAEVPQVPVRVNDCYPAGAPLATTPPRLLLRLPPLAPELQYRFLGRTLILLDVDASLIVDVLPDALPRHP